MARSRSLSTASRPTPVRRTPRSQGRPATTPAGLGSSGAGSGYLGIDAGGTRTTARWESEDGSAWQEAGFEGANLQLISDPALRRHLAAVAAKLPAPRALAIGMAGTRTERDRTRLAAAVSQAWPGTPFRVSHDLATALAAAPPWPAGSGPAPADVLVLSGTGSCCYGELPGGRSIKVGGWGHLLGDQGSGYDIALGALRRVASAFDVTGEPGRLGQAILTRLHLNEPDALIPWIQAATKSEIAALAPVVFECARARPLDPLAREVLDEAARALASGAVACAVRLAGRDGPVRFVLAGSVLLQGEGFAESVTRYLRRGRPGSSFVRLEASASVGALRLARELTRSSPGGKGRTPEPHRDPTHRRPTSKEAEPWFVPASTRLSPTEERNPCSMRLDRMSAREAIDLMLSEDERLPMALRAVREDLMKSLSLVVRAFRKGGRLFYVGAGTSGRLGILDASECPPTFRTPPDLVQGIIAGGEPAVFRAVEGAEDDAEAGARAVRFRGVGPHDVVMGIAASGRTPFVWGALTAARELGARSILLCFNPHLTLPPAHRPDVLLAPPIGPELLTGSTRLKAGTATKMVLNLLTTLAMVRMGKVVSNLMVDVNPANRKLRERAVRIVRQLVPVDDVAAREALESKGWVVKDALRSLGYRFEDRRRD